MCLPNSLVLFLLNSMTTTYGLPRWLFLWGLVLPLALLVGYVVATPATYISFAFAGTILLILAFPLFLRWHHAWVIFAWNASLIFYFAPGQPNLGVVLAAGSLGLSILHRTMRSEAGFIRVPSVASSLIFMGIVTVITA